MQEYCSNLTVNGKTFSFYDLEKAAKSHDVKVGELPYTIRILLESLLRKKDGVDVKESHISDLMKFPNFPTVSEVPFKPESPPGGHRFRNGHSVPRHAGTRLDRVRRHRNAS